MNRNSLEWAKWIPICIIAALLMIMYKTLDNFSQITTAVGNFIVIISPLIYGVLFAYFLYIPYEKVEKFFGRSKAKFFSKKSRLFSVLTIFLFLVLIIAFLVTFVAPILGTSIVDLANSIPAYIDKIFNYFDGLDDDSVWSAFNIPGTLRSFADDGINRYINLTTIEQVTRSAVGIAGGVFNILLGLIIALYMLLERENIVKFFKRLNSAVFKKEKAQNRMIKYLNQVNKVLFTFIASKGLDSVINLVSVTCILLIFNVKYAFLLGIIAGLFNFIPYLGSLIAVTLISVITLLTGDLGKAIQVLIPLLIFQQLDGNFIEPRIMKNSLKISPILVIVSVIAGGAYFGILGMFLAVPLVTIIKQILLEYISYSEDEGVRLS